MFRDSYQTLNYKLFKNWPLLVGGWGEGWSSPGRGPWVWWMPTEQDQAALGLTPASLPLFLVSNLVWFSFLSDYNFPEIYRFYKVQISFWVYASIMLLLYFLIELFIDTFFFIPCCLLPWNFIYWIHSFYLVGFPDRSAGKTFACQCRRLRRRGFNPWVRKIP